MDDVEHSARSVAVPLNVAGAVLSTPQPEYCQVRPPLASVPARPEPASVDATVESLKLYEPLTQPDVESPGYDAFARMAATVGAT